MARTLSLSDAETVARAAQVQAGTTANDVALAVVDASGHPLLTWRDDGCTHLNATVALAKARTAAQLGVPTHVLVDQLTDAPSPVVAALTSLGVVALPGGVPILRDGEVVGAIGVSGPAADDVIPAAAGVSSLDA